MMARSRANILLTIWTDPDFRGLPTDAQWLYFTMLTHESLSYCGVMDWRPARLAAMSEDMTIERVEHAAWELGQRRMIAVDPDTEEALVRSFVRHDGVLQSPNTAKGLVREFGGIASLKLMELVAREVRRAGEENPSWSGNGEAKPVSKQFMEDIDPSFVYVPDRLRSTQGSPSDLASEELQPSLEIASFSTPLKTGSPSDLASLPYTSTLTRSKEREDASTEAGPPAKRKRSLPSSWEPTNKHQQLAIELGLDLSWEQQQFTDKALGAGWKYVDWDRTFNNWLRNQKKYNDRDGINSQRQKTYDPWEMTS